MLWGSEYGRTKKRGRTQEEPRKNPERSSSCHTEPTSLVRAGRDFKYQPAPKLWWLWSLTGGQERSKPVYNGGALAWVRGPTWVSSKPCWAMTSGYSSAKSFQLSRTSSPSSLGQSVGLWEKEATNLWGLSSSLQTYVVFRRRISEWAALTSRP